MDSGTIYMTEPFKTYELRLRRSDNPEEAYRSILDYLFHALEKKEFGKYLIYILDKSINERDYIREISISYGESNIPDDVFGQGKQEIRLPELIKLLFDEWGSADIQVVSLANGKNSRVWARKN